MKLLGTLLLLSSVVSADAGQAQKALENVPDWQKAAGGHARGHAGPVGDQAEARASHRLSAGH